MIAYLRTLTPAQWFAISLAILGVLGGATAQLTDVFGPGLAHSISTISSLLTTILSAIMVPLTGQSAQIKAVNDMPGVSSIVVNKQANQALAAIAIDPATKVEATPEAQKTVEETAKAA